MSAAKAQLQKLYNGYITVFPKWTFPILPLIAASTFQSFAWMSGPIFLQNLRLVPRVLVLWLFAFGEYTFMSPTMNAAVEVLNMPESLLVVLYQVATLVVFMFISVFVFKKPIKLKYLISFVFLALAIYVTYI